MRPFGACTAIACVAAALAGCGGGDDRELTVLAAASLTTAFERYARPGTRLSFGGSDELAAQIRQRARPDVYAAANTELPAALFAEGLVERPESFATNELVLAVPEGSRIDALAEVSEPGIDVVVGAPTVPVGSYTREVLDRLPATEAEAIRGNVRSEESDVTGNFTGAVVLTGTARPGTDGLTAIELDGGGSATSTDPAEGAVAISVYPWEIAIEPAGAAALGSARNHLAVEVTSVTELGNRVRVGLAAPQPLTAEVTAASARELDLVPGTRASASWKAAATRIVRR